MRPPRGPGARGRREQRYSRSRLRPTLRSPTSAFDGSPLGLSPVDPGWVVDAYLRVAEEIPQREGSLARAVSDGAVRDHPMFGREARLREYASEFVCAAEGAVLVDQQVDWDVNGPATCPARPVSAVAPEGQKRSPLNSSSERTSSNTTPGSPIAASASSRDASVAAFADARG